MLRILLIILFLFPANGWCVTQWNKAIPAAGDSKSAWPGQVTAQWSIVDTLLSNYRRGETLTYKNATTITVTLGEVVVSNSSGSLRLFLQDAGNTDISAANLDTGASFSAGTTYYVYAATSSATASSSTYYISLSSSAPTGPTYYVQLGSFLTNGSAAITTIHNNNSKGFGTRISKSDSVVYQAATDGCVTAYSSLLSGSGTINVSLYSDSANPPTTLINSGSMHIDAGDTKRVNISGCVIAGDYWETTGASTVYFLPNS